MLCRSEIVPVFLKWERFVCNIKRKTIAIVPILWYNTFV